MLGLEKLWGGDTTNSLVMNETQPESLLDAGVQAVIGKPIDRIDGPLKVSGQATYAAEYEFSDVAYGVLVGATVGKGQIRELHAEIARAVPGVIDVITDYKTFLRNAQQGGETKSPQQGVEKVDYVGEPVAIVVAESYEAARDAALKLRLAVEYEVGEGRYSFEAYRDDTKKPPFNNIPAYYDQGDVEKALTQAPVTLDVTYTTPSQNSSAMEPHASLAVWDEEGKLTLYGSLQMPFLMHVQ